MKEYPPLPRVSTQVLVAVDQRPVRKDAVRGPHVEKVVGGPGELDLELLGEGLGACPVAAARIARQEQHAKRPSVLTMVTGDEGGREKKK
jgi:hypothetical protein